MAPETDLPGKEAIRNSSWVSVLDVENELLVQALEIELDSGEAQAITLAIEQQADLVLIDERRGRQVAHRFDLNVIGVLGILVEAKLKGHIQAIRPLLLSLQNEAGFRLSEALVRRVLNEVNE